MTSDEIVMFLGFLAFLLYPAIAIYVALQKKRTGFALGIFLSIFIGLGPFVSTYFFLASIKNRE